MEDMIRLLAAELGQKPQHVGAVVRLLDEGNTIPFIARYRKEQHGAMDDTTLRTLAERLQYLRNLAQRREEIRRSIAAQEKLTDELDAALQAAVTLSELEDLYRPYKPKRRTRATIARERGLAPLAEQLLGQARDLPDPLTLAAGFADPARGVETPEDALAGASDIVAETVSDDAAVRKALRSLMQRQSVLRTQAAKGKEEETSVYQLYYDFRQPVPRLQGHQILAVNRGEREGFLKVTLETDRDQALICVRRCVLVPGGGAAGGAGAGMHAFFHAQLKPGIETILDLTNFDFCLTGTDLVLTGEGQIDGQSLRGKVVAGVARRAAKQQIPVVAVVGSIADGAEEIYEQGVTAMFSINTKAMDFSQSRWESEKNLKITMENLSRLLSAGFQHTGRTAKGKER